MKWRISYKYKTAIRLTLSIFFLQSCSESIPITRKTESWFALNLLQEGDLGSDGKRVFQLAAQPWLGMPYGWGANGPDKVDCSGLVRNIFLDAWGISLPRTAQLQSGIGRKVPKGELEFGDLIFFGESDFVIDHVGIYWGREWFLNATVSRGVIFSHLKEPYWQSRFRWGRRITVFVQ